MKLTPDLLKIDTKKVADTIEEFIRKEVKEINREGVVVPISGGLDSSVVVSLCVRALGKEKVTGLMLPEKQGNPEAEEYAVKMADILGIKTKKINISSILSAMGTYGFILSYVPTKKLRDLAAKKFMGGSKGNVLIESLRGSKSGLVRNAMASIYSKQRIRAAVVYKFADENNLLVTGCAHKTEDLVGLFVKFGVDDEADIMPIKNLYRTQILQLAEYLGVPSEITGRTPNPDVIPGVDDKYLGMLGISADKIDMVLYGISHDLTSKDISEQLGVEECKIEEVKELIHLSAHMRHGSIAAVI